MTPFDEWAANVARPGIARCPIPRGHRLRYEWLDAWAYYDLSGPHGMTAVERAYWAETAAREKIAVELTRAEAMVADAMNPTSPAQTQVGSDNTPLLKGA